MENKTKEIILKSYDMQPAQLAEMANVLKEHVVKHKLYTTIVGRNYAHVEGWQFAGGLLGLYPRIAKVENMSNTKEVKWLAEVEIVNKSNNEIISRGFAVCSNAEGKKRSFDEYAVLSMAQTRAIGKAYRNLLGWVMKLAGYEGTPSEEMASLGNAVTPKTAPGSDFAPVAECHSCGNPITKAEETYSKKLYKKSLCRVCQKQSSKK